MVIQWKTTGLHANTDPQTHTHTHRGSLSLLQSLSSAATQVTHTNLHKWPWMCLWLSKLQQTLRVSSTDMQSLTTAAHGWLTLTTSWLLRLHWVVVSMSHWQSRSGWCLCTYRITHIMFPWGHAVYSACPVQSSAAFFDIKGKEVASRIWVWIWALMLKRTAQHFSGSVTVYCFCAYTTINCLVDKMSKPWEIILFTICQSPKLRVNCFFCSTSSPKPKEKAANPQIINASTSKCFTFLQENKHAFHEYDWNDDQFSK